MSDAQNKTIARRVREEFISHGDMALADELLSPEFVYYGPAMVPEVRGREAFKQTIAAFRQGFPDLTERIDEQFVDGDTVISRFTTTGTFTGELMGASGSGQPFTTSNGIDICRIADGKVIQIRAMFDALAMLQQIGLMPASEPDAG